MWHIHQKTVADFQQKGLTHVEILEPSGQGQAWVVGMLPGQGCFFCWESAIVM